MRSILNESDLAEIGSRVRSLSVSSTRRWGKMDVTGMLQHLSLSARMTLGELPVPSAKKRAFQVFPLKHLILYVLPFPKGAPTAQELKPDVAVSLEEERSAVLELLERISTGPREGAGPNHPLFGPLTWREWGVATYKHVDHHLRQFGA
ncbi:MAG TPA: DUF1569 domain-containing protein [Pyrinomonadaceae bacterium]|nr:DUF1569 domain-containing protein [Pyrinomonadaceae bacterium]